LAISYFGASTGAAAAVMAAAEMPESISTVVSCGGRVDLAGVAALHELRAPMLMIVGEFDTEVFNLNQMASHELRVRNQVELIEGATHLFEEGDSLQRVADKAASWFLEGFSSNNLPERRKVHVTHNR